MRSPRRSTRSSILVTDRPSRVVIVAASPRTGTNLLCRGLVATNAVGRPVEHLEVINRALRNGTVPWAELSARGVASRVRRRLRGEADWRSSLITHVRGDAVVQRLRRDAAERSADGTFSTKFMWAHFDRLVLYHSLDVDLWGAPVEWIHVCRRDTVRQAVSWSRANQTSVWTSRRQSDVEVVYDHDELVRLEAQARREVELWDQYFRNRSIEPLRLVYEDLVDDYEGTMRRVLDALGHPHVAVPEPQVGRMADALTDEWVRRFHAGGRA